MSSNQKSKSVGEASTQGPPVANASLKPRPNSGRVKFLLPNDDDSEDENETSSKDTTCGRSSIAENVSRNGSTTRSPCDKKEEEKMYFSRLNSAEMFWHQYQAGVREKTPWRADHLSRD